MVRTHSALDARCSSLETSPYGINVTCERLQNNLALMGADPQAQILKENLL